MFSFFKFLYFIGFVALFLIIAGFLTVAAVPTLFLIRTTWDVAHPVSSLFVAFAGVMGSMSLLMLLFAFFIRLYGVIAPLREGRSSIYGTQMILWAVQYVFMNFMNVVFLPMFRTTPLMNLFYRLMGAKVGRNVFFNSSFIYEPNLVRIGDNSRVGEKAVITPHTTEGKLFICKSITIGRNVTIGQYSQILPGAVIGDNAIVGAGAVVPKDCVVEDNAIYGGNPLRLLKIKDNRTISSQGSESQCQTA